MPAEPPPTDITLKKPEPFLQWLQRGDEAAASEIPLTDIRHAQAFGVAAIAALARSGRPGAPAVVSDPKKAASRFAHGIGLDQVIWNEAPPKGEPGRTVPLRRVEKLAYLTLEKTAREVARLIVPEEEAEETRKTIQYVLTELLRNVVQHSRDPLGGIVGAQRMDAGRGGYRETSVQVVVVDTGIGIFQSLRGMHPTLQDPRAALAKAIEPHISGAFPEGDKGTDVNAELGLFFIAEMAKLTGGRVLIATRGAALLLTGDPEGEGKSAMRLLDPGLGFPGTLVVFEAPRTSVADHDTMLATIRARAKERRSRRNGGEVFVYSEAPPDAKRFSILRTAEDASQARDLSKSELLPLVTGRSAMVLDFDGLDIATQSFLHALLFEVVRVAWALSVRVYVENADPAVRQGLDFLESYALGS